MQRLSYLVPLNTTWHRVEGGFDLHNCRDDTYIYTVSDSELEQLDPRLPHAIQMLPASDNFALTIRLMVGIWDCPTYLVTAEGRNVAVYGVTDLAMKSDIVTVMCYATYFTEHMSAYCEKPVLIPEEHVKDFNLTRKWLDTTYPGWEKRYQVARDLDFNITLAVRAMLEGVQVASNPNLPDSLSV